METFQYLQTLLFILSTSLILMICFHNSFRSNKKKKLPPSPQRLPIIGNLHQLGSSPHRSLQKLSRKHGPIMLLHLGSIQVLVVSSSQVAQEIFKTHDLVFSNRPNPPLLDILVYGCKDIVFSSHGEYWRRLRSVVVSHLLSKAQVKSFQNLREKETHLMIGILGENYGSPVNIGTMFVSLTENIMCRVALGKTYDGLKLTKLLRNYLNMFPPFSIGSYIPWLSWVDRLSGLVGKAEKVTKEFDEFLEDVIEEHAKKKTREDFTNDEGHDFIDILLDIQKIKRTGFTLERDTIKALILDIFGGGIDSTLTNVEWILSELVRNPRVMKKLQNEVTEIAQGRSMITEEDLEKMEYLKAAIKETMRLHPPIALIPRISTQDVKLMGYDIPAGTQVMVNVWEIGRDSTIWEEPKEFRPERFLTNSINYTRFHPEWLPFGGGRRSCPGILFGVAIIELVVANIVYKFDLALPNGIKHVDLDMREMFGLTVRRKSPLVVIASPRI